MAAAAHKSFDSPAIPRGRAAQLVGGPTIVEAAERGGVITMHRTQTGRNYLTARQFDKLVSFAQTFTRLGQAVDRDEQLLELVRAYAQAAVEALLAADLKPGDDDQEAAAASAGH